MFSRHRVDHRVMIDDVGRVCLPRTECVFLATTKTKTTNKKRNLDALREKKNTPLRISSNPFPRPNTCEIRSADLPIYSENQSEILHRRIFRLTPDSSVGRAVDCRAKTLTKQVPVKLMCARSNSSHYRHTYHGKHRVQSSIGRWFDSGLGENCRLTAHTHFLHQYVLTDCSVDVLFCFLRC